MKKYSAEELIKIRNGLSYMSEDNFTTAMNLAGVFDQYTIKKELQNVKELNMFSLLEQGKDDIIDAILSFYEKVVELAWHNSISSNRSTVTKKIIFIKEEIVYSKELDLASYTGAKTFAKLHEECNIKAVLNLCDRVSKGNNYTNIFEGDIICNTDRFSHRGSKLYLALLDKTYINPDSYYKELIFTKEFGFINPETGKPLTSPSKYKFEESTFNLKGNYNYHCFTIGEHFSVIGNITVEADILKKLNNKR